MKLHLGTPVRGCYFVYMKLGAFCFFLNDNNEILLCKRRDKDLWNLPGGRVEYGESPWDAALREVTEEIGVTAQIERLVGVYHKPDQDEVVFQFLARIVHSAPTISDEVADIQYFPMDKLPENTAPRQVERIRLYAGDPALLRLVAHASNGS